MFVVAVVAVVLLTIVLAAAARDRGQGPSATRVVSVAADSVRTVDLQAPPGQLSIDAARTGRVTLSGPVHWTGPSAVIVDGPRLTDGVLHLAYRCAAHSPCTGRLRLVVPQHCGIALRQPSGHVTVTGLAGPLRISVRSVDISAAGLRSPQPDGVDHLGPPERLVRVPARPGQPRARLRAGHRAPAVGCRLPGQPAGHLGIRQGGHPQASDAGRTITARVDSGELELLSR